MIYKPLGVTAENALAGTVALNWEALRQGATILRVHDVREAVEQITLHKMLVAAAK
jgi:dihydropteroate synthase